MNLLNNAQIKKVISGSNHTLALAGNSVYCWGNGESFQTGRYYNVYYY
jgi:alpha-tubulin suppressor-like RCC1 family protein